MKNSEIRELPTKEIVEAIEEQKLKLYNLRATHAISKIEQTHFLQSTKKFIARLNTELTQRKVQEQQNS